MEGKDMKAYKPQERRRNYFIKKEFQARFILQFCLLVILTAVISAFAIYRFSSQSVTTVFENSRLMIKPSTEFIMPGLILSTLFSVVLVSIATIGIVLFVSHRIAGPLYKVEASLERMANGDMGFDIDFRKGDEVRKLAEIFNATSQSLSKMIGDVKSESVQLNLDIAKLKVLIEESPQGADLKETLEKLGAANSRLTDKLNKFRLR